MAVALLALPSIAVAEPPTREPVFKPLSRSKWLTPIGPYWPERALREGRGGYGVVDCTVIDTDRLSACRIVAQEPAELSFGEVLLVMAKRNIMTAAPPPAGAPPPDNVWRFRVEFPAHVYSFVKTPADPKAIVGNPGSP